LLLLQWLASGFGSHVIWRGARVPVTLDVDRISPPELETTTDVLEVSDGR
jgi:ceramide glucosyltransferase